MDSMLITKIDVHVDTHEWLDDRFGVSNIILSNLMNDQNADFVFRKTHKKLRYDAEIKK